MPDWNSESMRTFRAYARHDHEAVLETHGPGSVAVIDQAVSELSKNLAEAGVDVRAPSELFAYVMGSHTQWAHALGHAIASCENPALCGQGFVVHSANASVAWRVAIRTLIQAVPGIPEEPAAETPPEYEL